MSEVTSIIESSRSYAESAVNGAENALGDAASALENIPTFRATSYNYTPNVVRLTGVGMLEDFNSNYSNQLALPDAPTYLTFTPSSITIPDAPVIEYGIDLPERPVFDVPPFSAIAPVAPDFTLPPDPEIVLKAAPTVNEIDLGDLDDVTTPTFDAEFNEKAPVYSDDLKVEYDNAYDTALPVMQNFLDGQIDAWVTKFAPEYHNNRRQLEAKIAEDMADGKAMSEEFETALYNRARSRVERERDRAENDLDMSHAKRGFVLPSGSLAGGRNKIHQATANAIASHSTELAIERAKYEIQHKQFVMGLSADLHKQVQSLAVQYAGTLLTMNGQALEMAKEVAGVVAKNYELLLDRYKEIANVFAIQASTYSVKLEASLANVKVFQARAEAAKVSATVDAVKIDAYDKELKFELAKIEIYEAQLEGIKSVVAINKQQIDAYGAQAQAYVATVKGKEAEFSAYGSAIRGEESKVKIEALKVDVFDSEVKASLAQAQVDETRASIVTEFNKAEAVVHSAGVDAFKASASSEASRLTSESSAYRSKALGYKTQADVEIADASVRIKNEELRLKAVQADWQVTSAENIAAGKIAVSRASGIVSMATDIGGVFAGMAQAAMSGQNSMVSKSEST